MKVSVYTKLLSLVLSKFAVMDPQGRCACVRVGVPVLDERDVPLFPLEFPFIFHIHQRIVCIDA
jgi:hypothetical protein